MLGFADIQFDVFGFTILSDNHTAVYFFSRTYKECSTILSGEQTVSNCLTGFECNQRSLLTILEISLVWCISVKCGVQDTGTLGGGKKLTAETDQTTGRDMELKTYGTIAGSTHSLKFTFTFT